MRFSSEVLKDKVNQHLEYKNGSLFWRRRKPALCVGEIELLGEIYKVVDLIQLLKGELALEQEQEVSIRGVVQSGVGWNVYINSNMRKLYIGSSEYLIEAVALRLAAEQCFGYPGSYGGGVTYEYVREWVAARKERVLQRDLR